jgi:molybdate transport system regulatory protein
MNKEAKLPLVERVSGGKGGGGTIVTAEGIRIIQLFESLNNQCQTFLNKAILQIKW